MSFRKQASSLNAAVCITSVKLFLLSLLTFRNRGPLVRSLILSRWDYCIFYLAVYLGFTTCSPKSAKWGLSFGLCFASLVSRYKPYARSALAVCLSNDQILCLGFWNFNSWRISSWLSSAIPLKDWFTQIHPTFSAYYTETCNGSWQKCVRLCWCATMEKFASIREISKTMEALKSASKPHLIREHYYNPSRNVKINICWKIIARKIFKLIILGWWKVKQFITGPEKYH